MPFIIYRYLAREILIAFLLGFIIFTGVLLTGRMLNLADMVVSKGVPVSDLLLLIAYLIPNFSVLTIPMSLLLAILLTFSRLSSDSELIVIKSGGTSLYRLLPPILLIAAAAYAMTTVTNIYILPKANIAFKRLLYQTAQGKLSLSIKEGVFNHSIPGMLIYINGMGKEQGTYSGVMIHDERNRKDVSTIFAASGMIDTDEESARMHIHLYDGSIHQSRPDNIYRHLKFNDYELDIDLAKADGSFRRTEMDMTLAEMKENLRKGGFSKKLMSEMTFEIHRRFSVPFACFIFALIAVPLGIQNRRAGKASGFSFSIAALLLYYVLQSFGKALGEKALLTPFIAVWLPNFIFLAAGIFLFVRSANEEQSALLERFGRFATGFRRRKPAP